VTALREAWPLWLIAAGVLTATLIAYVFASDLSEQVLYVGTQLELFGIALVAISIGELRREFGKPSVMSDISRWFGLVASAFRSPTIVTGTASVQIGPATMTARGRVRNAAAPNSSVERRLEVLEANFRLLDDDMGQAWRDLMASRSQTEEAIERLRDELRAEMSRLAAQTESVALGGVRLDIVGLVWLVIGCVFANINDDVARVLEVFR
jgi:hypothetical protein